MADAIPVGSQRTLTAALSGDPLTTVISAVGDLFSFFGAQSEAKAIRSAAKYQYKEAVEGTKQVELFAGGLDEAADTLADRTAAELQLLEGWRAESVQQAVAAEQSQLSVSVLLGAALLLLVLFGRRR